MSKNFNFLFKPKVRKSELFQKDVEEVVASKIPILNQHSFSILPLKNSPDDCDITSIDNRIWHLTDSEFAEYVDRLWKYEPSVLLLSESLYELDRPWKVKIDLFNRKVQERTSFLLENKSRFTTILSPSVYSVHKENKSHFEIYMHSNIDLWDAYSCDLCNDMETGNISNIMSMLKKLVKASPKPIWVTNLCVPFCSKEEIAKYSPAKSLITLKNIMTQIASLKQETRYFYTGLGTDSDPMLPHEFNPWEDTIHCPTNIIINEDKTGWNNFLGMHTSEGNLKSDLLQFITQEATLLNRSSF